MYTITRGPSKLVTQRRTGPTQQVESKASELKCRRRAQQQQEEKPHENMAPKIVFNRINGKKPALTIQPTSNVEESYTVAHEENVRFVYEAWQQVEQQLDDSRQGNSGPGPVQYAEKAPSPELKDFVPIDLEDWWAQQFLAKIENGS
ncbi:MAPK regulated corepressor interacting protein 2 [Anolis sagrei]|uniref:MAPK regulated corepressor interacting protein 2 n=1 Tax=Anolis sagrei TaxID=38937 RepID=UPI00295B07FD|nr:MAPK regulated corepressor interacting protein 2 [Anolis sagrei ordinatus]